MTAAPAATGTSQAAIMECLGAEAAYLLEHTCRTIPADQLHLPGPDFVSRIWAQSDRPTRVLRSLEALFQHGRLAGTGYLSILPVDQGIEHSAGASFARNPAYFDGEKIVELAMEGGCNAVAFHEAHALGMATVLWCYLRNPAFTKDGLDYHVAADLTGQANHLGVTIEADLIKQKLPETNRGFEALKFGRTDPEVYSRLTSDHPIDLCRYQVVNCYLGRSGLINSGGASEGEQDLHEAVRTAVINKRAGGTGLISGRKAFQRPMDEGIALLHASQDVYLAKEITVA